MFCRQIFFDESLDLFGFKFFDNNFEIFVAFLSSSSISSAQSSTNDIITFGRCSFDFIRNQQCNNMVDRWVCVPCRQNLTKFYRSHPLFLHESTVFYACIESNTGDFHLVFFFYLYYVIHTQIIINSFKCQTFHTIFSIRLFVIAISTI